MTLKDCFIAISQLWRGGNWGYFWQLQGRQTTWIKSGDAYAVPQGQNDIYWGVHPCATIPTTNAAGERVEPRNTRAQLKCIAAVNCLYADCDAKDFAGNKSVCRAFIDNKLFAPPSLIIDSGYGFHLYWYLSEPVMLDDANRDIMADLQRRFVGMIGGDQGAKDLCRVLRVPGNFNAKHGTKRLVDIVGGVGTEWDINDLVAIINTTAPRVQETHDPIPPDRTHNGGVRALVDFVAQRQPGERNRALYWAANRAFDDGKTLAEVETELLPAALHSGLTERESIATIKSASGQTRKVKNG